ncbi:MAG: helix-turn-helix transcriptional regulator [Lachnospiraceae bacterium]|nr:helix-turn-helix transcriptional regulator [Lachnospiraceae bacterium]
MVAVIDYEKLGNKIKSIRQSKNLTQDYIANAIGCNVSHVSNIENNHTKVSLNVLFSIADVLGVTMDYLLSDQLSDKNEVLELEIMKCVKEMPIDQKEQVLRIIRVL